MSKYTTSIETIICSQSNPNEPDIYKRIQEGCKFLFDFNYQIPNQDFKDSFEMQFCEKYWNECIGYETVPLFKMKLKQRLEMLMPEICFKYDALQKIINLENPALERQGESYEHAVNHSDSDSTVKGTGSASNSGKNVHSTTPANLIDADNIGKVKYADDGSMAESSSENTTKTEGNSSSDSNNTIERTFKEYGNLLPRYNEYYNSYHNIMKELLYALDDMFIQLLF